MAKDAFEKFAEEHGAQEHKLFEGESLLDADDELFGQVLDMMTLEDAKDQLREIRSSRIKKTEGKKEQ